MDIKKEYEKATEVLNQQSQLGDPRSLLMQITLPAYAMILRELVVLKDRVNTLEKEATQ